MLYLCCPCPWTDFFENAVFGNKFKFFRICKKNGWLVGCFGFNGPLRKYFSLYRTEREKEERRIDESKNVQATPPAPTASAVGLYPTVTQIVGRPGTGSLPSTIAPPDHLVKNEYFNHD